MDLERKKKIGQKKKDIDDAGVGDQDQEDGFVFKTAIAPGFVSRQGASQKTWGEVSGAARATDGRVRALATPAKGFPASSALSPGRPVRGMPGLPGSGSGPVAVKHGRLGSFGGAIGAGAHAPQGFHTRCSSQGGSEPGASSRNSSRDPASVGSVCGRDGDISSIGCWEVDTSSNSTHRSRPTTPLDATPSPSTNKALPASPATLQHVAPMRCVQMQESFLGFAPPEDTDRGTSDNSSTAATPSVLGGKAPVRGATSGSTATSPGYVVAAAGFTGREAQLGAPLSYDPFGRDVVSAHNSPWPMDGCLADPVIDLITSRLHQIDSNIQRKKFPSPKEWEKYCTNFVKHLQKKLRLPQIPKKERLRMESMIAIRCDNFEGFTAFRGGTGIEVTKTVKPTPEELRNVLAHLRDELAVEFAGRVGISRASSRGTDARSRGNMSTGSGGLLTLHMPRAVRRGSSRRSTRRI